MITRAYKRTCLAVALTTLSAFAQQSIDTGAKAEPWDCHTVALSADNPDLPYSLVAPYLEKQKVFQAKAMQLSDEPLTADVFVHLSEGEVGSTRIVVVNRRTHESRSASTSWTEYPGMVATDVMSEVSLVCRPPAVLVARSVAPVPLPDSTPVPAQPNDQGTEPRHAHGFKYVMGQTAYYAGQGLTAAAYVAGYTAYAIAYSMAAAGD